MEWGSEYRTPKYRIHANPVIRVPKLCFYHKAKILQQSQKPKSRNDDKAEKNTVIVFLLMDYYPPASEASRGVYWNQVQENFTHPYTEYP